MIYVDYLICKLDNVLKFLSSSYLLICNLFLHFSISIFFHYKKAFFDDLWNWLIFGYLNKDDNKFFIQHSSDEEDIFEFKDNDLTFLDSSLSKRILMHGKLIYLFELNYKISWKEIFSDTFDRLMADCMELCTVEEYRETQLTKFIKDVTDVLLKVNSNLD